MQNIGFESARDVIQAYQAGLITMVEARQLLLGMGVGGDKEPKMRIEFAGDITPEYAEELRKGWTKSAHNAV